MHRFSLIIISTLLMQGICVSQTITWQPTSGPSGGYVRALTTDANGSLFVGTSGGVFKSTTAGESWFLSSTGMGNALVYSLAASPNGAMFAGTFYDDIFRSTDAGNTWTHLGGAIFFIVNAIAVNAQGVIFAGDEEGQSEAGNGGHVYRSTDNGTSWTELQNGLPDSPVYQIQIAEDGTIFVGMQHGLFKSTNNGASWTIVSNGLWITWISDIAINRINDLIYVSGSNQSGTSVAIFRSTDNGNSFTQLSFPNVHAHTLGINTEGNVFAGTTGFSPSLNHGIYRSTDDGESFTRVDSTLSAKKFVALDANHFFVGTNLGVHLTVDDGHTWQFKGSGMASVTANALASDRGNTTYAGTFNGQFRTTDGGTNWLRLEDFLTTRSFGSIAVNSLGDVFGVNDLGRVYRSLDKGTHWTQLTNGLPGTAGKGLIFAHRNNMLFIAHPFRGIVRSTDNGESWQQQNDGMGPNEDIGAFASDQQGTIYVTTMLSGIWKSTNNGELWSRVGTYNGYADWIAVNASGHLFWGYSSSLPPIAYLYRSTDAGVSWTRMNISSTNAGTLKGLIITPNQHVFVAAYDVAFGGVYRSINNGDGFARVSNGLTEGTITSFGIDGNGCLLAGTTRGVFRTQQSVLTSVGNDDGIPNTSHLEQNYPNPFNPQTRIGFRIQEAGFVTLKVFDVLGRDIATLVNGMKLAGSYSVTWNASDLASGVYFYRLQTTAFRDVKRLTLVR